MKENELIMKLGADLNEKMKSANTHYEVLWPNAAFFESNTSPVIPDLVVHNKDEDSYVILELKHYDHQRPLSLSTIPLVRRLKADNRLRKIQVAVVTNSSISESLRDSLRSEHVPVIAYSDDRQISENVWNFLTAVPKQAKEIA